MVRPTSPTESIPDGVDLPWITGFFATVRPSNQGTVHAMEAVNAFPLVARLRVALDPPGLLHMLLSAVGRGVRGELVVDWTRGARNFFQ